MNDFDHKREEQHVDPDANEPWQIVKQTEGMDADETRRVAGPDWEPGVQGDVEADGSSTTDRPSQGMSEQGSDRASGGSGNSGS